jgi:RimJ/RimL family protein N-acetyltransferase
MGSPVQLCSPRVVLRSYRTTDAEVVWEAIEESRPSLARWVPDIGRRNMAEVEHALASLAHDQDRGTRLIFGVWERSSGQFLGEVGLYEFDQGAGRGEVGYWLRRTARRQGYATEALGALLGYANGEVGLERFEAHIAGDNAASRRLAERLGFRMVGRRAPAPHWDAQGTEVLIYVLAGPSRGSAVGAAGAPVHHGWTGHAGQAPDGQSWRAVRARQGVGGDEHRRSANSNLTRPRRRPSR